MNSTSFFYNHASQWRYEKLTAQELLSPTPDRFQRARGTYGLATLGAAA